jgi:hypothetical protein
MPESRGSVLRNSKFVENSLAYTPPRAKHQIILQN